MVGSVLCFVCLRPVSCVPNVASFSELSILDCSFGFLQRLFVLFVFIMCLVYPILCLVYPMLSLSLYCPFLIAPSVFYNFLLMWASFIDTENTTFTKLLLLFVSTFPYMCKNHDSSYQLIVSCLLQVQEIRPMDTTPVTQNKVAFIQ